ncbi:MAG: biopolymer transporter ExbD [Candidatus Aminicenantes bacterium]|nr:biopolymer transporter ExbD [Candidatus Aminicenantes bacterium]
MQFRSKPKRKALLNITSLIDVLFLLLIFLMVSTTFLEQPGIKLELPEADSAIVVEQKEFTLYVDKSGKVFLNDNEIAVEELEEKIKKALPEIEGGAVILKADQEVSHGLVVRLMDIVKKSGAKKLVIGTRLK